jgi:hypothetical protein
MKSINKSRSLAALLAFANALTPIQSASHALGHGEISLIPEFPGARARAGRSVSAANSVELNFANESRDTEFHYSVPLTTFTTGWKDPENIQELLAFIAPDVPADRRFEFKNGTNAEYFLTEADDIRATGADFKRIEYTGQSQLGKTLNKGLRIRVDRDEVVGNNWRESYTQRLLQRLWRNELVRTLVLLDAAATNVAKTWTKGNTSTSNPDGDVRNMLKASRDQSGLWPNHVLYGALAWLSRVNVYETINTPNAGRRADFTPEELATKLMVGAVEIAKAQYQSGAAAKTDIVGSAVYAYNHVEGATLDDPSNFKRVMTPTEGGGPFRVYTHEGAKFTDIMVEHYSTIINPTSLGVEKITVTEA